MLTLEPVRLSEKPTGSSAAALVARTADETVAQRSPCTPTRPACQPTSRLARGTASLDSKSHEAMTTSAICQRATPSLLTALAALAGALPAAPAFAVVSIDYVSIGNAGNAADPLTSYGAVVYAYQIGKYEVTNAQYVEFLNAKGATNSAVIFNGAMAGYGITQSGSSGSYSYSVSSTYANMPVGGTTWFDAARFTNWLGNDQGGGSMETGAYTLNGAMSGVFPANAGAQVYIPSENEWYKAAYYNGATSAYSLYPNGQNSITPADANYYGFGPADVDYGTPGSYGTYGQGGNVWEWNDAVISNAARGKRGGAYGYGSAAFLASSYRYGAVPTQSESNIGFRIASVPEPGLVVLAMFTSGVLVARRKR